MFFYGLGLYRAASKVAAAQNLLFQFSFLSLCVSLIRSIFRGSNSLGVRGCVRRKKRRFFCVLQKPFLFVLKRFFFPNFPEFVLSCCLFLPLVQREYLKS